MAKIPPMQTGSGYQKYFHEDNVMVVSSDTEVGPDHLTYAPQLGVSVWIYNFTDTYLFVGTPEGLVSQIPPVEFRDLPESLKLQADTFAMYRDHFIFVHEIRIPRRSLNRNREKVKVDLNGILNSSEIDKIPALKHLLRETHPNAILQTSSNPGEQDECYQIIYAYPRRKCREAHKPIYLPTVNLLISTKDMLEDMSKFRHPFSGFKEDQVYRDHFWERTQVSVAGVEISFNDLKHEYSPLYINIAGQVVKLNPTSTFGQPNGIRFYYPKTIPNGKGGLQQDPDIISKVYSVEELLSENGVDGIKVWRTAEEAKNLGSVEEIQKRIDRAVEIEVNEKQNQLKRERAEWELKLLEQDQKLKEAERRYEEAKANFAKLADERKDYYDQKAKERKDEYESRSTSRSDTSEAWSTAFKIVGTIAAGSLVLYKIFS